MRLRSFGALALAGAAVCLLALAAAKVSNAHAEARYCANASILGVERDKVCSITNTGVNYLSCVAATPFFGTVSCYAKYAAVVGIDYRYCDAGEQGCVN